MTNAVAGGASTLSLSPAVFPGNWPAIVKRAGAYAYDAQGKQYLDCVCGLLAVTLGHAHPEVVAAVETAARGWTFSEEYVAQQVRRLCGYPEGQVRFTATGTHACEGAIRIARALTGRTQVLSIGYHGWSDAVLTAAPGWGVPVQTRRRTHTVPWGDLAAAEAHCFGIDHATGREDPDVGGKNLACIIVEPATLDEPPHDYLHGLKLLCDRYGCLLIFDECITGGRYPGFTYGNTDLVLLPDLTVLSKGLANGMPLGAIVGRAEVMACFEPGWAPPGVEGVVPPLTGPVYVSGTWSAPNTSLAAAAATLKVWEREKPWERVDGFGSALRDELHFEAEAGDGFYIRLKGPPYRLALDVVVSDADGVTRGPDYFDRAPTDYVATTLLRQLLVDAGVLTGTGFNLSLAHCSDAVYNRTVEGWKQALGRWLSIEPADRSAHLAGGHVCRPPYRQA